MTDRSFYLHWILANGWSEAIGLGSTFVIGTQLSSDIADFSKPSVIALSALFAVGLGIVLEGVIVGAAQGRVLNRRLPAIRVRSWLVATAVGAGLAWTIGMIPSTVLSLIEPSSTDAATQGPRTLLQLLLAVGLGFAAGPILGVAQWFVLRKHVTRSVSWLWANALAWSVGMPVIFAGMDLVPWEGPVIKIAFWIYSICLFAGFIVGIVHGLFLVRLTRTPTSPPT